MLSYTDLKANLNAILFGSSDSAGPALVPTPATLDRPEGARRYLIATPPDDTPGKRALVIAPDAGAGGWSDCFASAERVARKDDVGFVDALVKHAIARHDVDPDRVYLIGVSRGGWMAYRVAIEIPQTLAAFCVVLAGMPSPGRGKPWYVPRLIEPLRGIEASAQVWRELAGLPDTPDVVELEANDARGKTSVTRFMWGRAPDGLQVGLYRITGAGHAEPSRLKRYPRFINWLTGLQNADLEVAEAAWDFFREKRLSYKHSTP